MQQPAWVVNKCYVWTYNDQIRCSCQWAGW